MNHYKVYIDPRSRILFASYYIQGLYDVFGKKNVHFTTRYFTDLEKDTEAFSFEHYFAFVICKSEQIQKVIVDFCDPPGISERAYDWCDCYAKINFHPTLTEERFLKKLINIPPGFGIRIWNAPTTAFKAIRNYVRCKQTGFEFPKKYFKDYYHHYKRTKLTDYSTSTAYKPTGTKPYVFMIASLWKDKNCIEKTNYLRRDFVSCCKTSEVDFEGGFYGAPDHPQYEEFKEFLLHEPYTVEAYIAKTKASTVVFNTPAVHFCHGWKLGEYLALGKAIITTPLYNAVNPPLKHNQHLMIANNTNELTAAIQQVTTDTTLKTSLEKATAEYYQKYASPKAVIKTIIGTYQPY